MPNNLYECPECKIKCDVEEDDQRFDAYAPDGGLHLYGNIYLVSTCCGAIIADCDEMDCFDDYEDDYLDNFPDF